MNDHDLVAALREALEPLRSFEPQQPPQGARGWAELIAEAYRRRGEAEDAALRVIAEALGGEGSEVPTHPELAKWTLQEGPDPESPSLAALAEESGRLTALLGSEVQPVYLEEASVTVLQPGDKDRLVDDSVTTRVDEPVQVRWEWKPFVPEDPLPVRLDPFQGASLDAHLIGYPPAPDGWSVMTRTIRVLLEVVELWCDHAAAALEEGREVPKLPLAALMRAWQAWRGEVLRADKHRDSIIPKGLLGEQPAFAFVVTERHDPDLIPLRGIAPPDSQIPLGFPEMQRVEWLPGTSPVLLANWESFRHLKRGSGARIDKRLAIYGLTEMPLDQRRPGVRYLWKPTLKDLVYRFLYSTDQAGKTNYRPGRHGPILVEAFDALNVVKVPLPDGRLAWPIHVRRSPRLDDLDSEAEIIIELPEGRRYDHGPAINLAELIRAGKVSDPAFDLEVGLAYYWDQAKLDNGGFRIYATRPRARRNEDGYLLDTCGELIRGSPRGPQKSRRTGKVYLPEGDHPQRDWRTPGAVLEGEERHPYADRVRVLHREARRRLAYGPKAGSTPQRERAVADKLLRNLEREGRIIIEEDAADPETGQRGWRVLERWPDEG